MKYPEDFASAPLNLEIDLGEKGGVQRFKTVSTFQDWLNEESEFWSFAGPQASRIYNQLQNVLEAFWNYDRNSRDHLNQAENGWRQRTERIRNLESEIKNDGVSEEQKQTAESQLLEHEQELGQFLGKLNANLTSVLQIEIINSRQHISRFEPVAQYIKKLTEEHKSIAIFALDQVLLNERDNDDPRRCEHAGRLAAELFLRNLNRKIRVDQKAFQKAIVTWSEELADFKSRYELQESQFNEISQRHQAAEAGWIKRADEIADSFDEMRSQREDDLRNLTEAYETHMQLKGPLVYWKNKRKEHGRGKCRMGFAAGIAGLVGAGILVWATQLLLPESQSADEIPWRSIGLFVLISTFVLWIVRLFVKLMLSHIHLYADAREREVMISTFMALVRRQESREGIAKMDLALVLAPIFKPSTTGVIQDDGGPTTLTDFIGLLSGK